jgi:hypothetical protein
MQMLHTRRRGFGLKAGWPMDKSQDSSKVSKEAKKAPNGEHEKEVENTSNRKRKHDDVADEKPTDSSKILKVDEKNDKAINAHKSKGGRNNRHSTKTQQNDDARGRAPPHRNNNRSQGRDDRKGMQDVSGLGGGEHPDRRGRNDGGRNAANRRTRGHNRN